MPGSRPVTVQGRSNPLGNITLTDILKRYLGKLALRILIFLTILTVYLTRKETLFLFFTYPTSDGVHPLHLLWAIFMLMMLRHLFPGRRFTMALRKSMQNTFQKIPDHSPLELYQFVHGQNIRAWKVMISWLLVNGIFGVLFWVGILGQTDLLMLTVFYFLCDYLCILFFCPFQSFIMKNTCCVNCRIYDWGHFMMFLPMAFIQNFFSWSLFFTSCLVLIRWELGYAAHPERFWRESNAALQCAFCQDKTCQIKKKIAKTAFFSHLS